MRFLLYTVGGDVQPSAPPSKQMMDELAKLTEETTRSGVLLATGGLGPAATRVRNSAGKVTVTDGPFTETKELTGGFALVEVKSREEAIEGRSASENRRRRRSLVRGLRGVQGGA